jgi:hypothetical protein
MTTNFADILRPFLDAVDRMFGENVPLSRRPVQAALIVVEELILEVPTGSKAKPEGERGDSGCTPAREGPFKAWHFGIFSGHVNCRAGKREERGPLPRGCAPAEDPSKQS